MIKPKLAALVLLFAGFGFEPAFAQQNSVTIRGGEHPTYSRLVFPTVNALQWELRNLGREARLVIPGTDTEFLTERVFDRVARTRLLDLDTSQNGTSTVISLRLGCECDVVAELDGENLILDIKDKTTAPVVSNSTENEETGRPTPRPQSQEQQSAETTRENTVPSDLASRLISQLNKAAEQGIIELSEEVPQEPEPNDEAPNDSESVAPDEELPVPPVGLQPEQQSLDGLEGVAERVEDSLAETFSDSSLSDAVRITIPEEFQVPDAPQKPIKNRAKPAKEDETQLADHCVPDEVLDIAYWADEREYSEQFSALQSQVFGEFDTPDQEAVLSLARFFIFFGLGTEAKSLLQDLELDEFQSELLFEIAHAVEGNPHIAGGRLDKSAGCEGAVSLWRTAAIDKTEEQPVSNTDEIIDIFSEYPIQVRRIIGPRLVQSFLIRGQVNAANQIFAIVERAAGYHGARHELMRADLTQRNGDTQTAEDIYWRLVYENGEVSAKAATRLVTSMLNREAQVPVNVIDVLETMAFELRGSEQGTELLLNAIKAKANSNRIRDALETAFTELDNAPENSETYYQAVNKIFANLTIENVGMLEFSTLLFENLELLQSDKIDDPIKLEIANGSVDIGLPNTALRILSSLQNAQNQNVADSVANASFKAGQLQDVLALENSYQSENIALAQAMAFSRMGQHDRALTALGDGQQQQMETLNWRAGNWDKVVTSAISARKTLSEYMLARASPTTPIIDQDLQNPEDAMRARLSNEAELSLKYVMDVQEQSSSIRNYLSNLVSEM